MAFFYFCEKKFAFQIKHCILHNMATRSTVFKTTSLRLPEKIKDAMKKHSNNLPIKAKCVRNEKGSINHFMVYSVLKVLKDDFGENFKYLYPEYYQ